MDDLTHKNGTGYPNGRLAAPFSLVTLIKIKQIYRVERFATKKEMTVQERTALRQTMSKKVLKEIKILLQDPGFVSLPETLTGKAINYFLRNWEAATRFIESGDLPIDNTADERIIRPFAIGRNNWLQAGSENGARWMAIRPKNAGVSDLLPVQWYKNKNGGSAPKHTPLYPSKH
jgi:transposase